MSYNEINPIIERPLMTKNQTILTVAFAASFGVAFKYAYNKQVERELSEMERQIEQIKKRTANIK